MAGVFAVPVFMKLRTETEICAVKLYFIEGAPELISNHLTGYYADLSHSE